MCSRLRRPKPEARNERLSNYGASNNESLAAHERPDGVDVPDHVTPITRHYIMQWDNSLASLAANPSEATWSPVDGCHQDLFGSTTRYAPNAPKAEERKGDLSQAILIGMKVKKIESNFPCQLGLKIEGCKGNYYTCNNDRYAYLIGANEKSHNLESVVATTSPYVKSEYLKMFPGMTRDALRTQGIVKVPNESYVFVDKSHPIVDMMLENNDVLQLDMENAELIDGRWYKVNKVVADECINELESELVDNLPLLDLQNFNAKIERLYSAAWDDDSEINVANEQVRSRILEEPRKCTVVVELMYSFI